MSKLDEPPGVDAQLPKANVKRSSRGLSVAWIVPLVAAIVAGYVAYDRIRELGPKLTITFSESNGIVAGQTPIKYRGVEIGKVTKVALSDDHKHAMVSVRLHRSAASIAKSGSVFWIVRPELSLENITGLRTVISGPEIQVSPGTGAFKSEFAGLGQAPVSLDPGALRIVLRAARVTSLGKNSPVTYRGVKVGVVKDIDLTADAAQAEIHVQISRRFTRLVHSDSVFWNVSGLSVSAGLFKGLQVKMESLRSLAVGGIAFATPPGASRGQVKNGMVFTLYSSPAKQWLAWAPWIAIPSAE